MKRTIILAAAVAAALPATAGAHVTVHPNVIPEGAFAVLNVRVPNETDDANTTKVQVQMPDGFEFVSSEPPPGWKAELTKSGKTVSEVTFSGGSIPPGQFKQFPLSVGVPGSSGDTLTFKALQTYDNGDVVRWIGAPDADLPAPTISISETGGLIEDSTGEHGVAGHDDEQAVEAAPAATTKVVEKSGGDGLAIAALIVGALGLLAGGAALSASRRG